MAIFTYPRGRKDTSLQAFTEDSAYSESLQHVYEVKCIYIQAASNNWL